jgi:hypothetical protein
MPSNGLHSWQATRWLKLRSVNSTAALSDNSLRRAVDGTDASFRDDDMQSVCATSAGCDTIPDREKG